MKRVDQPGGLHPAIERLQIERRHHRRQRTAQADAAGALYSGNETAATIAGARAAHSVTRELPAAARFIFRTGAIDLARRVRADLLVANGVPDLLDRFLTEDERRSLAS